MKRRLYILYIIVLTTMFIASCSTNKKSEKTELEIYCAASLNEVISYISNIFAEKDSVIIKLNLASSGTLARQIENGATPAIFISANKVWMDYLDSLGLTVRETERAVSGNTMVLIVPRDSQLDSMAFSADINLPGLFSGRLSVGDPQYVPAGQYTVQLLEKLGCKEELEPRFLPGKDVRSALMVVELGEVEAGIVYKTDALKSQKVKIITEFPDSLHEPVKYYISLIKGQQNEISDKLYNFIVSEEASAVWKKYGFKD